MTAAAQPIATTRTNLRPARLLTEAGLLRRASLGDTSAFAEIYRRHHQAVYRFCRSLLVSDEDAQDALQSTMAAALKALPGEARSIELRAWLFRVARNECMTLLRKRRPTAELDEAAAVTAADGNEQALAQRDRLRELVRDLQALPERQRSALVMRELSGLDYAEIGVALDTTTATAKQAVYEARTALQALAEGRAMSCEEIRRTLSEGDGRARRGRKLRSHLRACRDCHAFATAIDARRSDLALLAPPLPAALAASAITGLLGDAGGSTGAALSGVGAAAAGPPATIKTAVAVVATVSLGAGGYGIVERAKGSAADRGVPAPAVRSKDGVPAPARTPVSAADRAAGRPVGRRRAADSGTPRGGEVRGSRPDGPGSAPADRRPGGAAPPAERVPSVPARPQARPPASQDVPAPVAGRPDSGRGTPVSRTPAAPFVDDTPNGADAAPVATPPPPVSTPGPAETRQPPGDTPPPPVASPAPGSADGGRLR